MKKLTIIDSPENVVGGEIYYRKDKYAHNPELLDAYECGKADGWRCAMEEIRRSGGYNERRDWREMPPAYRESHPMQDNRYANPGYPMMRENDRYPGGGHPDYREPDRGRWNDPYAERHHRDEMGRYSRY